eukprot:2771870-Rhodomonas_salina.1
MKLRQLTACRGAQREELVLLDRVGACKFKHYDARGVFSPILLGSDDDAVRDKVGYVRGAIRPYLIYPLRDVYLHGRG